MKKPQALLIFFLIYIISVMTSCSTKKSTVKDTLKKIPLNEQQELSLFFEELIKNHLFGYTLFGDKPVSETSYYITPVPYVLTLQNNSDLIIKKGALVWKKYKELFPLKDFILKFEAVDDGEGLIIINASLFRNKVNEHIDLFKEILGNNTTADSLLETLGNQDLMYFDTLQSNQVLIGLLFGFGKHNSLLYDRFIKLSEEIENVPTPPLLGSYDDAELNVPLDNKLWIKDLRRRDKNKKNHTCTLVPNSGFKSIQEEFSFLERKTDCKGLFLNFFLQQFKFPSFRIDLANEESKQIIHSFVETQKKLSKIYSSEDFLEITLKKLTGED